MRRALALVLALAASVAWADPTHFSGPVDSKNGFTVAGGPCISAAGVLEGTCVPGGGGGSVLSAIVDLTTAQIATLHSAPVTLVAAPGAGLVLVPVAGSLQSLAGTEPFGVPTFVRVGYPATDHLEISTSDPFVWSVVASEYQAIQSNSAATPKAQAAAENAPLELFAGGSDPGLTGSILTTAVNAPGTGYAPGDTGTVVNPLAGTTALYAIDTVDGGGGVLTFHLTNNGTQYSVATGVGTTVTAGGGDGAFAIDVNTITPLSDGVARVQVLYYVMTLR
jgi:hypothetical protein